MVHAFSLPYCVLPLNEFCESVFFPAWHNEILLETLICFVFSLSFLCFLIVCSLGVVLVFFPFPSSLSQILSFSPYFLIFLFAFSPLNCVYSVVIFFTVPEFPQENYGSLLQETIDFMYTEEKFHFLHSREALFLPLRTAALILY